MKKYTILIPVYNDWDSLKKLLDDINKNVNDIKDTEFSCVIINDASKNEFFEIKKPNNINSIEVITMQENRGHARCIAFGLRYLSKSSGIDYLIIMDGDGEDRPEEIKKLVEKSLAIENFSVDSYDTKSLDIKDFDIFFAKGLSLENGASTLTDFTAKLISDGINYSNSKSQSDNSKWLVCGGGRKNKYLLESIKNNFRKINISSIDQYGINGDFIESQAFAFLAIRSLEKMPISFPSTTRCKHSSTGGVIVNNF